MGRLWPDVPADAEVHGHVSLVILEGANGKPVLAIEAGGRTLYVTANIAEMIGGAGRGATLRWEDHR